MSTKGSLLLKGSIINKTKQNQKRVKVQAKNVCPNAEISVAKRPRRTLANLPLVEGPTRKAKNGPHMVLGL